MLILDKQRAVERMVAVSDHRAGVDAEAAPARRPTLLQPAVAASGRRQRQRQRRPMRKSEWLSEALTNAAAAVERSAMRFTPGEG